MRLITTTLFTFITFLSISQNCTFLPSDTIVCGFKHSFPLTEEEGNFYYECDEDKLMSISSNLDGSTMFSFAECGDYEIIFESNTDNCLDTFHIQVSDPSQTVTTIQTVVNLGYGDIDCPGNVIADCYSEGVSIPIASGPPEEVWSFCTIASCQSTTYSTEINGDIDGCLVDTISCDTLSVFDSSDDCIETNQDAFIVLTSDGEMVDNDTFLEYISQLQAASGIDCTPIIDSCPIWNDEDCIDSTVIDTSYLHIPVRIGGQWTLANIDSVELFDTTYFEYFGRDYELILDPGVEFYGQGNLDVYLYEINVSSSNDTIKYFPYGFHLELQWEEDWILDTLQVIREIPTDIDGDCFTCGGNFFNTGFNVPDAPDFPCGPVSIDYPDICECEYLYPDYSLQLINCEPKEWQLDILGGYFEIYQVYGAEYSGGVSSTILSEPTTENISVYLFDLNGCFYEIYLDLESIVERVRIETNGLDALSCEVSSVSLEAGALASNELIVDFHENPVWHLPNGETETSLVLLASEPGNYILEYQDEMGCVFEDNFELFYDSEIEYHDEFLEICDGEVAEYNGISIEHGGVYTIEVDCNDFIILNVNQIGFNVYQEYYEVCIGESITVHGQNLTEGIYDLEISNGSSCPDIAHVEINETEPETVLIQADLCYGECYDDGTYSFCQTTQSIIDVDECTRLEVDVKIAEEIITDMSYSLCEGEGIEINNQSYSEEGIFESVFVSQSGCDSTLYFSIDVLKRGEVRSDNVIDCTHDEALMQYTSLNENETYQWKDKNGVVVSDDIQYLASQPGIYTIEVTVEGTHDNCTFTETYELVEDFEYPEIILEDTYSINCESTAVISMPMEEGMTWKWEAQSSDLHLENEILAAPIPDVYTITVTNEKGCTSIKSIEVLEVEPIDLDFSTVASCERFSEGILNIRSVSGGMAPYTIMLDEEEIGMTASDLDAGYHELKILQSDGCIYEENIIIEAIPDLDDTPVQYLEYCNNNGINITLNLTDEISYKWLDGYESAERHITQEGVYDLEISNGCNTIINTYNVEDTRVEERYIVSNIFSPNGNLANVNMKVVPQVEVQEFKLYIFSREGSLVFESSSPEDGWDGKIGGNKVVLGSYVWMIESSVISCSGEIEKVQDVGTVMVIY